MKVTGKPQRVRRADAQAGDWADHVSGTLDPRRVARIDHEQGQVWLILLTPEPVGPLPIENYNYSRS